MSVLVRVLVCAVAFTACKPSLPPIDEQPLTPLELPGLTLSLPLVTQERPDTSWYAGESFSRLRSGGYVQVLWRRADPPWGQEAPDAPPGPSRSEALSAALRAAAARLGEKVDVAHLDERVIAGHVAARGDLTLDGEQRGHLITWFCPRDGRLLHLLVVGAALEIEDKLLGAVECHTWSRDRRVQSLDLPNFDPLPGFEGSPPSDDGTVRWQRGHEVLLLSFGLNSTPARALADTRESLPAGLSDVAETRLIGPDQRPRARITGRLLGEHTAWLYTWDLLDCGDRVYLATHTVPADLEPSKPHPLDRLRCP